MLLLGLEADDDRSADILNAQLALVLNICTNGSPHSGMVIAETRAGTTETKTTTGERAGVSDMKKKRTLYEVYKGHQCLSMLCVRLAKVPHPHASFNSTMGFSTCVCMDLSRIVSFCCASNDFTGGWILGHRIYGRRVGQNCPDLLSNGARYCGYASLRV